MDLDLSRRPARDTPDLERFIRLKYTNRSWVPPGASWPPSQVLEQLRARMPHAAAVAQQQPQQQVSGGSLGRLNGGPHLPRSQSSGSFGSAASFGHSLQLQQPAFPRGRSPASQLGLPPQQQQQEHHQQQQKQHALSDGAAWPGAGNGEVNGSSNALARADQADQQVAAAFERAIKQRQAAIAAQAAASRAQAHSTAHIPPYERAALQRSSKGFAPDHYLSPVFTTPEQPYSDGGGGTAAAAGGAGGERGKGGLTGAGTDWPASALSAFYLTGREDTEVWGDA